MLGFQLLLEFFDCVKTVPSQKGLETIEGFSFISIGLSM